MRSVYIIGAIGIAVLGLAGLRGPAGRAPHEAELAYTARVINQANSDGTYFRARVENGELVLAKDRVVTGQMTESSLIRQVRPIACSQPGMRRLIDKGIHLRFEFTNVGMEPQPPATITECPPD